MMCSVRCIANNMYPTTNNLNKTISDVCLLGSKSHAIKRLLLNQDSIKTPMDNSAQANCHDDRCNLQWGTRTSSYLL